MTTRTLVAGGLVLTQDPALGDLPAADILIEDGTIRAIGPALETPGGAEVIDASDMIVMPGFTDTHRHTWQTAVRHTYADIDPLQYFAEMLGPVGAAYTPEDVYLGTLLGALSALDAGITTLVDWAHVMNTPGHADAAVQALTESGIRAVFAHGWPLTPEWTRDSALPHPADIRRLKERYVASDDQLLTLAMAARGPEMARPDVWLADLRLARDLGIRTTVHVGAYAHNAHHRAVARLRDAGVLGPDLTFIHCCRSHDDEIAMIADAGASVSLGVHCELNSPGMGDIPLDRILAAGLRPGLSGDTETKCAGDMFTQMRLLLAYHRSWTGGGHSRLKDPPPLGTRDVLEFATLAGARVAGLGDLTGSLTPGKQADLILIRANDLNLAPVTDPAAAVVLAAHPGNVDTVLVAGRPVKRGGRMLTTALPGLLADAERSRRRVLARIVADRRATA
ncbi:amidohydrolase family protein [Streptomyces sp. NBC_01803]|uniref:amidohydrolase family protein n=1 Tax=Streptomyces sp. NBC_01803 TaxID=2975946 RepID=UPI002DD7C980|nr:amidohydrolase family protein [Streptomyces sp. NBC_01803]WSA44234.1 amidohydrolase family protein [Streptomyces sp. NBC_01803]